MSKTFERVIVDEVEYNFLDIPGTDFFKFEIVSLEGANVEREYSNITGKNVYGIAHLIEHLGFRNPKDFTTKELAQALKDYGDYNASTDHDRINYYYSSTTKHIAKTIQLVYNYTFNDLKSISPEEFAMERKIVANEANKYCDDLQEQFQFESPSAALGFHPEDTVIGIADTINKFTIEDCIEIKAQMMATGNMVYNITYDSDQAQRKDIMAAIQTQHELFNSPFVTSKKQPSIDCGLQMLPITIKNEADQDLTSVMFDVADNVVVSRAVNNYLNYHSEHSLFHVIREDHGLTYGTQLYNMLFGNKVYTAFFCDASTGDGSKILPLMEECFDKSLANFSEGKYLEFVEAMDIQRTLRNVNLNTYQQTFWDNLWYLHFDNKNYRDLMKVDLDHAMEVIHSDCTYLAMKDLMQTFVTAMKTKTYTPITNY